MDFNKFPVGTELEREIEDCLKKGDREQAVSLYTMAGRRVERSSPHQAIEYYNKALNIDSTTGRDVSNHYSNISAVYEVVLQDASKAADYMLKAASQARTESARSNYDYSLQRIKNEMNK